MKVLVVLLCVVLLPRSVLPQDIPRARDLGVPFDGSPGALNAITDVAGVTVGHATLISGEGPLVVGSGPVRTGVTAILPRGRNHDPVFAGWHALNGNGEMTGTTWLEESGFLEGPIVLTNTSSVGVARDAVIEWRYSNRLYEPYPFDPNLFYALPVVAETFDGILNDINGFHVSKEHVFAALNSASSGSIAEGNVGGGTGMICYAFKGGIGTASRVVGVGDRMHTVGVLVQANHGSREELTIGGVPIGREITDLRPQISPPSQGDGSIIAVVATDAPLMPHQLDRIAQRVTIGIARVGSYGANGSGDIFIAFSTANDGAANRDQPQTIETLPNDALDPLFLGTVQATEEAIVNALIAARTMTGARGATVYALPHDQLLETLQRFGRLE